MAHPDSTQISDMHAFLAGRQVEILRAIRRLVEIESPSGDFEGSRAVVDLLVNTAREIPVITSKHVLVSDITRRGALVAGLIASL